MGKVSVKNAIGDIDYSEEDRSPDNKSWRDYYWSKRNCNPDNVCRFCNKEKDGTELVGGHVKYCEKGHSGNVLFGIFIIQICIECNNCRNNNSYHVDEDELIPVPLDKLSKMIQRKNRGA